MHSNLVECYGWEQKNHMNICESGDIQGLSTTINQFWENTGQKYMKMTSTGTTPTHNIQSPT